MAKTKQPLQIIIVLTLIISLGISITSVGSYEDKEVLLTEDYTLQVSEEEGYINLNEEMKINNKYAFTPIGPISIDDILVRPEIDPMEGGRIESEKDSYSLEFSVTHEDIDLIYSFEIHEDRIKYVVEATNTGDGVKTVNPTQAVRGIKDTKIFFPSAVENETDQYAVLTNHNRKGLSLGIQTNTILQSDEAFQEKQLLNIDKPMELQPGSTNTFKITLTPVNIWEADDDLPFDSEYSYLLENPLISSTGETEINVTGEENVGKIDEILNQLQLGEGDGEFIEFSDVDVSGTLENSLEATIAFKETCIQEEIPCKIVVGDLGGYKYSWIRALENNEWVSIDPFQRNKIEPGGYTEIYEEPKPTHIEVEALEGEEYLEEIEEIIEEKISILPALIPVVLFTGGLFIFLYLKSSYIIERLGTPTKEEKEKMKKPVEGRFKIKSKKGDLEKEAVIAIFEKILEEDGVVDLQKYAEETEYSKEFIEQCIIYLVKLGHIEPEWDESEEQRKKEETKRKEDTSKSKLKKKIGKIADKIRLRS